MVEVSLDGITAEYLIESGVSASMSLSNYRPGGDQFNDREAMRWAVSHRLGLFTTDMAPRMGERELVFCQDSDGLDADQMRRVLDTVVTYGGRRYVFRNLTCEAELTQDYGGEYVRRWIEVRFQAV